MNDSKNESPALLIRNATLKLEGNTILHDFNWQVERGERWFILGPNGAGKTTLVKMILGMAWPLYGAEVRVLGCRYGSCDINETTRLLTRRTPAIQLRPRHLASQQRLALSRLRAERWTSPRPSLSPT